MAKSALPANEQLGRYIRAQKMSQSEFGRRIGRSQDIVSRLVRGERRPDIDTAAAIEKETDGAVPAVAWAKPTTPTTPTGRSVAA